MDFPRITRFAQYAALLCMPLAFVACGDDDDEDNILQVDTISEILEDQDQFEQLEELLDAQDLISTLDDDNQTFTLSAPTNSAVTAAQSVIDGLDDATTRAVLLYHVLGARVPAADITADGAIIRNGNTVGFGGSESVLFARRDGSSVRINGATVTEADIMADNGIIHAIDQVLTPPTVVDVATYVPTFSSLVDNLMRADGDLPGALSGAGPFTVFAPTNTAFSETATGDLSASRLAEVLQLHVVSGNVLAADLSDGDELTTLNGGSLTVGTNAAGNLTLTDPNGNTRTISSTTNNVQTANGVIHAIDGVLLD